MTKHVYEFFYVLFLDKIYISGQIVWYKNKQCNINWNRKNNNFIKVYIEVEKRPMNNMFLE